MKKKYKVLITILALVLIALCLWYTRARTMEQLLPDVELSECVGLRISGYEEDGNMEQYNIVTAIFTRGDPEFEAVMEMLESRKFSLRLVNLLPRSGQIHRTEPGDAKWRMHFSFEDFELDSGTTSGFIFGFDNFYGDLELNYMGEKSQRWRITTKGKNLWLAEITNILFGREEWTRPEASATDVYAQQTYDWSDYVPDEKNFGVKRGIEEISYTELRPDGNVDIGAVLRYDDGDLVVFQAEKGLYAYSLKSREILIAVNTEKAVGVYAYQGSEPCAAVRVSPDGHTIQLFNTDNRDYCIYIDPYEGAYWFDEYAEGYISEDAGCADGYVYSDRADGAVGRISEQYYFRGEEKWELFGNFKFPGEITRGDFDHDGVEERVFISPDAEYPEIWDLCISEANEGVIWTEEDFSTSHVGWNSILSTVVEGEDYLVRFNPYMSNGIASYSCEIFHIQNGEEIVIREWKVDFRDEYYPLMDITPEMAEFAAAVNELAPNCTLLFSTLDGAVAIGPVNAVESGVMTVDYLLDHCRALLTQIGWSDSYSFESRYYIDGRLAAEYPGISAWVCGDDWVYITETVNTDGITKQVNVKKDGWEYVWISTPAGTRANVAERAGNQFDWLKAGGFGTKLSFYADVSASGERELSYVEYFLTESGNLDSVVYTYTIADDGRLSGYSMVGDGVERTVSFSEVEAEEGRMLIEKYYGYALAAMKASTNG